MLALNGVFNHLNFLFLALELLDKLTELLLQDLVLGRGVQVIDLNTGDLIDESFNGDFLLRDVLIGLLGLLQ
jgi:hypothetical protein